MARKKQNATKKHNVLEVAVSDVFVVNGAKHRPFIEQFCHAGVNFTQKDLGTIMGFFIVRDTSSMSENIVNFLVSEIKKYYFSQSQKTPEEKFESTLHRINRMLEELATIGNVNWLGAIDGAVCAVTGATARFSVTGAASIFLLRDDHLVDIGDGLASEDAAHNPLKTFADISMGELLPYDKLIITSSELLDLVTFDELQKNAVRMGQKNFVQYVQTVLSNQCTIAVTLIADLYPQEEKNAPTVAPVAEIPTNFFGALPPTATTAADDDTPSDTDTLAADIAPHMTDDTSGEDYVDPQTGHIYMQGSDIPPAKPSVIDDISDTASDFFDSFKHAASRRKRWLDKRLAHFTKTPPTDADALHDAHDTVIVDTDHDTTPPADISIPSPVTERPSAVIVIDESEEDAPAAAPTAPQRTHIKDLTTKTLFHARCIGDRCIYVVRTQSKKLRNRIAAQRTHTDTLPHTPAPHHHDASLPPAEAYLQSKNPARRSTPTATSFLPRLSRIPRLWRALSLRSKLLAIGILLCIIIAPLIVTSVRTRLATPTPPTETPPPTVDAVTPEPQDPPLTIVTSVDNGTSVLQLKDNLVAVGARTLVFFDGTAIQKTLPIPDDADAIAAAAAMDDLNMIFFLTERNTLYSVSPVDGKFTKQPHIPTWDTTKIASLATYMTYLYVANPDGVTRHTRIDGGFDAGKSWLKDTFDTTHAAMAIDENIYLANGTTAAAFLSGRKTTFTLDARVTRPSLVFATPRTTALWIIDTDAARLYKIDKKTGAVQSETAHTDLGTTTSFIVNEATSTAYILTGNDVKTLAL